MSPEIAKQLANLIRSMGDFVAVIANSYADALERQIDAVDEQPSDPPVRKRYAKRRT
jgi:hypothetical protein